MSKLKIELSGLFSGYSTRVRGRYRLSDYQPSISHVKGILAACLGYRRDEPWTTLDGVAIAIQSRMGQSVIIRDYQTVQNAVTNDGSSERNAVTQREYHVDASTIVTLTADDKTIEQLRYAVRYPVYAPYLGRKCCVPSTPLTIAPIVVETL